MSPVRGPQLESIEPETYPEAFGMRLRELRSGEHESQSAFARALTDAGIKTPASVVSRWESGVSSPNIKHLPLIAHVIGCEIADLFPAWPVDQANPDTNVDRSDSE